MVSSSPLTSTQVQDAVLAFVIEDLGWEGDPSELRGATAHELAKVLDSQDLMELASFLEDSFGIEVADSEVNSDNFGTLDVLAEYVVGKVAHRA